MSFDPIDDDADDMADHPRVPGTGLQRKTGTRAFRDRDAMLRHILAFLQRGGRIVRLDFAVSDGARHYRADHIVGDVATWRTAGKPGRPAGRKRRGETADERKRRLSRERQARHRAKKTTPKEPIP